MAKEPNLNLTVSISDEIKAALEKDMEVTKDVLDQLGIKPPKKTKVAKAKKPVQSVAEDPVPIEKKQAQASIQITNADGTQTTVEEAVGKPKFFTEPHCTVSVGAKLKLQIVKYECHAEASIHISVPCAATEIDDVADFAQNWVDKRMQDAAQKLEQAKQASS